MIPNVVGVEVAGALARFWSGGNGPSHASISSALSLAGYIDQYETHNKQQRVLFAVRDSDDTTSKRLVEELLGLLRAGDAFDAPDDPRVSALRTAFSRRGFSLSEEGFVDWKPGQHQESSKTEALEHPSVALDSGTESVVEVAVPDAQLLAAVLRRLAPALRPLVKRRRDRVGIDVNDEYDLQDVVEALLRCLYHDVRAEERTPSYAGSSSVMDFLLREDAIAVEVKVTSPNHAEKRIKLELLVDINDYQQHPSVTRLIAVVYDLASTMSNPTGFERDLSGRHNDLEVQVIVVGWPIPR